MREALEIFLARLRRRRVKLWLDEGRLRCAAPKGALSPAAQEELSERKAEVVAYLEAGARAGSKRPPLEVVSRDGELPLSSAQERLWFMEQLDPGNAVYNLSGLNRFSRPIDAELLKRVLAAVIDRHETLRTTVHAVGGRPLQRIAPNAELDLPQVDLSSLSVDDAEAEVGRRAFEEARRPFDLERGPLCRFVLFRLPGDRSALQVTIHHIIGDYRSGTVLYQDVAALFEAFAAGEPSPLAELPVQYADYAAWQRRCLTGPALEKELDFWLGELEGITPLDLPTDRPRPAVQSTRGRLHYFDLPADLMDAVSKLARREKMTPFMVLLAGFNVLLWRYSGSEDVVVGTPISTRGKVELDPLIGNFLNNLVLRGRLEGNPTFLELMHRVRNTTIDAFSYQDLPFERLVEALQPDRDLSRSPLFQVLFDMNIAEDREEQQWELAERGFDMVDQGTAVNDLAVHIVKNSRGGRMRWQYNTDLFDLDTVCRMAAHYQRILESAVENAERPIAELTLLARGERRRMLVDWNRTELELPRPALVHRLVEEQAAATPERIAASTGSERLTYQELDQRSNQVAHFLAARGVAPGDLVGISTSRSPTMLVGLLGILKAGAAYVPLDPAFPGERRAYMVEDSGARVVITEAALAADVPTGPETICLDSAWPEIALESTEPPVGTVEPSDLAYVIYTSGSTGKPKGVQLEHRTVVNFLAAMAERPGILAEDVLLAVTTLSFDISVLELLLPLTVGARVEVVPQEMVSDGARLRSLVETSGATVMQATPATWQLLLASGWPEGGSLKALCGGEALPRELAARLLDRSAELWNMYGPTETTVWSTVHRVEADEGRALVLIGKPIANTTIYILDECLEPVPPGVPGRLFIGGEGLARGYRHRPRLTAEKFVADPFSTTPGARMYETGDLARYLSDGGIEFLGRSDHQVKVRGFRIELGEIEAALLDQASVRQAVVVAREDAPGDRRLVAYLVAGENAQLSISGLRSSLAERLPEYMIPSGWMVMDALPLTPNGKVNRRALPAPDSSRSELLDEFVAPESGVERQLAGLWAAVLTVDRVGLTDNFFDLGGHSLLATQVLSAIQEQLGAVLSLREFFEQPTIGGLASLIEAAQWAPAPARGRGSVEEEVLEL